MDKHQQAQGLGKIKIYGWQKKLGVNTISAVFCVIFVEYADILEFLEVAKDSSSAYTEDFFKVGWRVFFIGL